MTGGDDIIVVITCPVCASPLNYDEVDIGVGIQTGNYRCDCCGWSPEQDDEEEASYRTGHFVSELYK